jgi:23S rRNA pseudouridine2604 synthase
MRINRYLALQKKASRRDADRLIEAGRVMLNDKKAKLGDKVNEGDSISILSADDARTDRQSR